MTVSRAPVIFLAYANDRIDPANYLRDLVAEIRAIRQIIQAEASPPYELVVRPNATLEDIIEVFSAHEGRVQIFHFAGHADSLHLMLEQPDGDRAAVGQAGFTHYLSSREGLRFVFLNGCMTYAHAELMAKAGLPAVLATSRRIQDRAAMEFATAFYEALGTRKTLQQAFREAEAQTLLRLDKGEGVRGLYLEPQQAVEVFPWALLGEGTRWRIRTHRAGARGPLIPLMCDRDPQVEVFRDKLETLLTDQSHPPHLFLLHGTRNQRLSSLSRRLVEADIRYYSEQMFGMERGVVHSYHVPEWPTTGELDLRQRNLKRNISRALNLKGLKGAEWSAHELMQRHHDRAGTVVIRHQIAAESWDSTQLELLDWYIGQFWQMPADVYVSQYLILIQVVYPDRSQSRWRRFWALPGIRQRVSEQLYGLGNTYPEPLTLLRELQPVSRVDVQEWVDEYYPEQLMDLPDQMFNKQLSRRLSMQEVERFLRQAISALDLS